MSTDETLGRIWRDKTNSEKYTPIGCEALYIDEVIRLMIDEMIFGADNSKEIMEFLRAGARDMLEQDVSDDDGDDLFYDDQRQRAHDLKRDTARIYGWDD